MDDWQKLYAGRAARMQASEIRELLKLLNEPGIISFAGGIPDPALFPVEAFRCAYAEILSEPGARSALQYGVSEGSVRLRKWIVEHMRELGIACAPENILITTGSQQALDYLGKLFLASGDTALVGLPTYLGALQAFNCYEPAYQRLEPGANMPKEEYQEAAAANGGNVKFAYLSPDFANPTGASYDLAARQELLDLADTLQIAVIEDAPYQSLRYEGDPVQPILALDCDRSGGIENARTLYCGSFSKTLSPGLRLGWICGPSKVMARLVLIKQASDLNTSVLNQEVMARVAEREFEPHVDRIRAVYKERRDAMLAALDRHMPHGVRWTRPAGGMFIWLDLPDGLDAAELLKQSLESARVAFVPGKAFYADGSGANTMRLSFSCASVEDIETGIAQLAKILNRAVTSLR